MPDYEIIRWDESNFDVSTIPFTQGAHKLKKFGYLIDYVRLHTLYAHGGIFLDLDFLFLSTLDPFLSNKIFFGLISENNVGMGIVGSGPQNATIGDLKSIYESLDGFVDKPSTEVATDYFNARSISLNEENIEQIAFYPPNIFYSFPLEAAYNDLDYRAFVHSQSVGIHLWENSWILPEFRDFWFGNKKMAITKALKRILKNPFLPMSYYKDLGYHVLRILGVRK